jgi:hypothetical protein
MFKLHYFKKSQTGISAAKAQVVYKKLTGSPDNINFFE